jgi:ribosomal-protein-alanine N-acetyltransferase
VTRPDIIAAGTEVFAAIHASAFPHDKWKADSFTSLLSQPGVFGFVDAAGGILLLRIAADEAEILTIGVTTPRQGIARRLLKTGIEFIKSKSVANIHLEVAENNLPALGLYRAFGFTQSGRRKSYYPDGSDALMLRLDLL